MSDETIINRAVSRAKREFEGEDRRQKPPFDWLKILPFALALVSGYGAYQVLAYRVERLESDFREYRAEHKEAHKALWQRIGKDEP